MNVFDIIGPVMIGPSSSHTAGAVRIGRIAGAVLGGSAACAHILLHGSFARTYKGHGTDKALVAGIMGMGPEDDRIRHSLELAEEEGLKVVFKTGELEDAHPNTARIELAGADGKMASIQASSTGGGNVKVTAVNDMPVLFTCHHPTLIVLHQDEPGMIAAVAEEVGKDSVNICSFYLSRDQKGGTAVMTLEMDAMPAETVVGRLKAIKGVSGVTLLEMV